MVQADMYCEFAVDIAVMAGRFIKENSGKIQSLTYKGEVDLVEQLIYILNKNVNDDGPDALEGAVAMVQLGGVIAYGNSEDIEALLAEPGNDGVLNTFVD